jgi:hypothetical protein
LASALIGFSGNTARSVGDHDGGFDFVAMLSTWPTSAGPDHFAFGQQLILGQTCGVWLHGQRRIAKRKG